MVRSTWYGPGDDFVVRGESFHNFNIRGSGDSGFDGMEQRDAVLDREDAFLLDLLLDRFVGIVELTNRQGLNRNRQHLLGCCRNNGRRAGKTGTQFLRWIIQSDDDFEVFRFLSAVTVVPVCCPTCSARCSPLPKHAP